MNALPVALLFAARVVLEHVNVIDGTGAAAQADRNVVIESGKIAAITPGADVPASDGTTVLDLHGRSVMPGIVGMHDHLCYIRFPNVDADGNYVRPVLFEEMAFSAPRLYLANGVTTIRTTGSIAPYEDLRLKEAIDAGTIPGPHLDVTGPYLEGAGPNVPLSPSARATYLYWRNRTPNKPSDLVKRDMEMERAFVRAGGLLIAGPDPVGVGGNVPGFADHRELELLVEAGFTPLEAIRIATLNGATFLGRDDRIGSIAAGKNADLVIVKGDPATRIEDIEQVELVFKDGVQYDRRKLLDEVKGTYGDY